MVDTQKPKEIKNGHIMVVQSHGKQDYNFV